MNSILLFCRNWWWLAVLAGVIACNRDGGRNVKPYYFPIFDLQEGLVYAYDLTSGDSSAPEYWYYRTFVRDSGHFLTGTFYDHHFQIGQFLREKIEKSGATVQEVFLYETDPLTGKQIQVPTRLEGSIMFPFSVKDTLDIFLFSLKYQPSGDPSGNIYLNRNRRFLGDGPVFEFNGKKYPTVRFALREIIGMEPESGSEIQGRGEEWYAKDLGLVYYKKEYGKTGEYRYAYRLREIFSMEELERRAAEVPAPPEEIPGIEN